jgi:hypothetical protein
MDTSINVPAEQSSSFQRVDFLLDYGKYRKGKIYNLKKVVAEKYLLTRYAIKA